MKRTLIFITLLFAMFIFSCKEKPEEQQITMKVESFEPKVNFKELETDFMKWWTYYSNNIILSSNFIGLDENFEKIDKKLFLKKLTSGKFIPLKLKSINRDKKYKLYKLDSLTKKNIRSTIKNVSLTSLKQYQMEGLSFPEFNFTDLNGNNYTNRNTEGNITVIKTWFINCMACVAEFPELNEFVEKNKNSNDILFISLALDSEPKLNKFIEKKHFEYKVIANQQNFIEKELNLQIYPTHIVLDKNGTILKVVNKASEMISFLEKKTNK